MKTTSYEPVFGQPRHSVIAPDCTVGGIMDETAIQLDQGSSDDVHHGNDNDNQEDKPSRSDSDNIDHVPKRQISIPLQYVIILSYIAQVLQFNRMIVTALIAAYRNTIQQASR